MQPLIIKSQLTSNEYYKLNLRVMWKRVQIMLIIVVALLAALYFTNYLNTQQGDTTLMWLGIYFLFLFLMLPLIRIIAAKRQYKKVKALSEPKTYTFTGKGIHIEGITTTVSMDWSNVNKAADNKNDITLAMYNSKSYIFLKHTDFVGEQDLQALKDLVKAGGVKNNFK